MQVRGALIGAVAILSTCCAGGGPAPRTDSAVPSATVEPIETTEAPLGFEAADSEEQSTSAEAIWSTYDVDYLMREGATSAAGGGWFFTWGGFPDRSPGEPTDGLLFDADRQQFSDVPAAPLAPRYLASTIWTGSEFIVFGGFSRDRSFADGAAFDPTTGTWRPISPAPFEPARLSSTVWTGSLMLVWTPKDDSPINEWHPGSTGQFASYDPATDVWEQLPSPLVDVIDVALFAEGEVITLIGGPPMRDVGGLGPAPGIQITSFDMETKTWTEPFDGPKTDESVRPFVFGDDGLALLSASGLVQGLMTAGPPLMDLREGCWWDVAASQGNGHIYLKTCGKVWIVDASTSTSELITSPGQPGATANTYGSAFVTDETGRLFTFDDSQPNRDGASGSSVLAIHTP